MTKDGHVVHKYEVDGRYGDLLCVLMVDPSSDLGVGTSIDQTLYWQRKTQSWVSPGNSHNTSLSVTSGITETQGETLSFSVGASVGFNQFITAELSAALTQSFTTEIAVTQETTITDDFWFEGLDVAQVDGVYQLIQTFTVRPGPNLVNFVNMLNAQRAQICSMLHTFCNRMEAVLPFEYPASSYLQVAGTDQPGAAGGRRMLSDEELAALVEQSVKLVP